jgi:hypothetical protein
LPAPLYFIARNISGRRTLFGADDNLLAITFEDTNERVLTAVW